MADSSWIRFLLVGLGGALGAAARYAIGLVPVKTEFPFVTLFINLLGAVLIGAIVGYGAGGRLPAGVTLFLKTGVCGGFTTFSTFSLEAWTLLEGGRPMAATAYVLLSVTLCILGVAAGQLLGRGI